MKAEIAISTCDRAPQYVHGTLESMFARDHGVADRQVTLVVCGYDATYLERWHGRDKITVKPMSSVAFAAATAYSAKHRTAINFMRLLELATPDAPLIACQDDLDFTDNWLWHAEEIAHLIERKHGSDFVLSLYGAGRFKGEPYAPYNQFRFYGNQALYLPAHVHVELRDAVRKRISDDTMAPDDMMVKDFVCYSRHKLFVANPSIVQHVGEVSAVEQRFHRSPTFSGGAAAT